MKKPRYNIALIGPGKVGTTLCNALINKGHTVGSVVGTKRTGKRIGRAGLRATSWTTDLQNISSETNIILITTPGPAISGVAKLLASNCSLAWNTCLVIHTSGSDGVSVLEPLRKRGARVAAIHPIQTFPNMVTGVDANILLDDITYGYDAPANSRPSALSFIKELGGKAFHVPATSRPLYHALCVFASGYSVQVLQIIEDIRKKLPGAMPWHDILGPLFLQSVSNAFNHSPLTATTGPIVRGDVVTIKSHMDALRKISPRSLPAYATLGLSTVDHLEKAKKLDKKTAAQLRKTLKAK